MKYKIIIPLLIIFLSAFTVIPPEDITIITKTGAFKLTSPEKCINSNCLNIAIRTAQLAGKAVDADIESIYFEEKRLSRELLSALSAYFAALRTYDTGRTLHKAKLATYTTDLEAYNAQTVRTTEQKAVLDNRLAELDLEKNALMLEWNALQFLRASVTSKQSQIQGVNDRIDQVQEQLKLCKLYGERAIKISKTRKWGNYRTSRDCFGTLKSIELLITELEVMKTFNERLLTS